MEEKVTPKQKYELIDAPDVVKKKHPVKYQLRAIVDFGNVKTGELGGYVDSPDVLSHDGDCWIYPNAYVYGGATVIDNSIVLPKSVVTGYVTLIGDTSVCCMLISRDPSSCFCSTIVDSYIGDLTGRPVVYLALKTKITQSKLSTSCDFSYLGNFYMKNARVESTRDIFTFGNMFYPYSNGNFGIVYRTKNGIFLNFEMKEFFAIHEESKEKFIETASAMKNNWNKYVTGVCDAFVASVSAWFNDPDFKIAYDEKMKS